MEEVKDSWLKDLLWDKPKQATQKDDILKLLKERLVALQMIDMCSLYFGKQTVKKITDWTVTVCHPLKKDLKQLIGDFNGTKIFQSLIRKKLEKKGIALLNKGIKNVMWLSEVSEEKQKELLDNADTWSFYEKLAGEMLLNLETPGRSK